MNTIYWLPSSDPDVSSYRVEYTDVISGTWTVLQLVSADQAGPNFADGKFFCNDETGPLTRFYRLTALATDGSESAPSAPFQAHKDPPSGLTNRVRVDENYGGPGALSYRGPNGVAVNGAQVRIFSSTDFQTNGLPLALTWQDAEGKWNDPVFLPVGLTYIVQYEKMGEFGPDHTSITV